MLKFGLLIAFAVGLGSAAAAQPIFQLPRMLPADSPLNNTDGLTWVSCQVIEIAAFEDRTHVRCANGQGQGTLTAPPDYIAVDVRAHPALASSLVTEGVSARSRGIPLNALVRGLGRDNPPGCDVGNCRGAFGFFVE